MTPCSRRVAPVVAALLLLLAVGCGDDDDDAAASTTTTGAAEDDAADDDDGAETVAVIAVNYRFSGLPSEAAAGTSFTFHNDSEDEVHELVLIAFAEGEERSAAELVALPEEESAAAFASLPALVAVAAPGEDGQVFLGDSVVTEPGRYLAICAIQLGADPDEYFAAAETSQGPVVLENAGAPHFTEGMYQEITID